MSGEHLLIIVVVGIVAGWLAGLIVAGGGLGLIGDLIVGSARSSAIIYSLISIGISAPDCSARSSRRPSAR